MLDYGSSARGVSAEHLARIFETGPLARGRTFHAAFADRFGGPPPATLSGSHRLVIVASELDSSTERIIDYLLEDYGVPVNVVFFRYFRDGGSEYLGRSWLKDPQVAEAQARGKEPKRTPGESNGIDYYVLFGDDETRSWEDARSYGYVSAGGGTGGASHSSDSSPEPACSSTTPTTDTSALDVSSTDRYRSATSQSWTAASRDHC